MNVKNIFTSHIDKKVSLTFLFLTTYLYTFSLYKNPSFIICSAETELSLNSFSHTLHFLFDSNEFVCSFCAKWVLDRWKGMAYPCLKSVTHVDIQQRSYVTSAWNSTQQCNWSPRSWLISDSRCSRAPYLAFGIGIISKALHLVAHDRAKPRHVHSTTSFMGEVYSSIP